MVSRRNVISVCIVVVVAVILVIMLFSVKTYNEKAEDKELVTAGAYDDSQYYKDDDIADKTKAHEDALQEAVQSDGTYGSSQKYIVRDIGDGVAIYKCIEADGNKKEEFYDYALINTELCDEAMAEALKNGIELSGEGELYEFLQAYSS